MSHSQPHHPSRATHSSGMFLTPSELAHRWKCSLSKLQRLRAQDRGPAFFLDGRTVRYRVEDVERFERDNLRGGEFTR